MLVTLPLLRTKTLSYIVGPCGREVGGVVGGALSLFFDNSHLVQDPPVPMRWSLKGALW